MNNKRKNIESILNECSETEKSYYSFTTQKHYNNIYDNTASGLLADAVATTTKLIGEKKSQHKYAIEIFAAFCMYHCENYIQQKFKDKAGNIAGDTVSTVYTKIIRRIKRDHENGKKFKFIRNLIKCSAKHAALDMIQWYEKPNTVNISLDDEDNFDIEAKTCTEVTSGGIDSIFRFERMGAIHKILEIAEYKNIIDEKEMDIICSLFGIGAGYEKITASNIAEKYNMSNAGVTRMKKNILEKLASLIEESDDLKEIIYR